MLPTNHKNIGFTFVELIVVVALLGIVAAFGIPNFQKSVAHARRLDAMNNLYLIHSAQTSYLLKNGDYYPPAAVSKTIDDINANLGLDIVPNTLTYQCTGTGSKPCKFTCTVTAAGDYVYTITLKETPLASGTNPVCTGSCP